METNELASSLRFVVSALHKGLRKQVYSVISYSMTEIETISLLNRNGPLLPTELATLTRVKTQSISQILKNLEAHGIIKRSQSKDDKRKTYISLTSAGKKLVEKTKYDRDEWLKIMINKKLKNKEKEQLAKMLPVLYKLIETK